MTLTILCSFFQSVRLFFYLLADEVPSSELKEEEEISFKMETEVSSKLLSALGAISSDSSRRGFLFTHREILKITPLDIIVELVVCGFIN